jgi:hypothetical protein
MVITCKALRGFITLVPGGLLADTEEGTAEALAARVQTSGIHFGVDGLEIWFQSLPFPILIQILSSISNSEAGFCIIFF